MRIHSPDCFIHVGLDCTCNAVSVGPAMRDTGGPTKADRMFAREEQRHAELMAVLAEIRDLLKGELDRRAAKRKQSTDDALFGVRAALAAAQGDDALDALLDEALGRKGA